MNCLSGMPNVFGIADDILIAGFHDLGRDHDATIDKVLRICRKVNLKPNKDKYLFSDVPAFLLLEKSYCSMV